MKLKLLNYAPDFSAIYSNKQIGSSEKFVCFKHIHTYYKKKIWSKSHQKDLKIRQPRAIPCNFINGVLPLSVCTCEDWLRKLRIGLKLKRSL